MSLSDSLVVTIDFGLPNIMTDVLYNDKFVGFIIVFHSTSSALCVDQWMKSFFPVDSIINCFVYS